MRIHSSCGRTFAAVATLVVLVSGNVLAQGTVVGAIGSKQDIAAEDIRSDSNGSLAEVLAELKQINSRLDRIEELLKDKPGSRVVREEKKEVEKKEAVATTSSAGVTLFHKTRIGTLMTGAAIPMGNGEHRIGAIPEQLKKRNYTPRDGYQGNLRFRVDQAQTVYAAMYGKEWGQGGNPSGNWQPEIVSKEELVRQGWKHIGSLPVTHSNPEYEDEPAWIVYERECETGETFCLRTHKYQAPVLIWGPLGIVTK